MLFLFYLFRTALAEAELEYNENHKSKAIIVKFKMSRIPEALKNFGNNIYVLIWTTTPWTLPANQAVAFNPSYDYLLVNSGGSDEKYVIAKKLLENVQLKINQNLKVDHEFKGNSVIYFEDDLLPLEFFKEKSIF